MRLAQLRHLLVCFGPATRVFGPFPCLSCKLDPAQPESLLCAVCASQSRASYVQQ